MICTRSAECNQDKYQPNSILPDYLQRYSSRNECSSAFWQYRASVGSILDGSICKHYKDFYDTWHPLWEYICQISGNVHTTACLSNILPIGLIQLKLNKPWSCHLMHFVLCHHVTTVTNWKIGYIKNRPNLARKILSAQLWNGTSYSIFIRSEQFWSQDLSQLFLYLKQKKPWKLNKRLVFYCWSNADTFLGHPASKLLELKATEIWEVFESFSDNLYLITWKVTRFLINHVLGKIQTLLAKRETEILVLVLHSQPLRW